MKKEIGYRVKMARVNASMTQEELAEKANVSTSFISRLETGKILPSIERLYMLANIMNVGLQDLLCDLFRYPESGDDSSGISSEINYYIDLMSLPEKQYLLEYMELFHRHFSKS